MALRDLLLDDDGVPLARLTVPRDGGDTAVQVEPVAGAPLERVAARCRRDLAGRSLQTPDDGLAAALVATGLRLERAARVLRHDLAALPAPGPLPEGWSLRPPGWDADLAAALAQAYGPGHADGGWTAEDTTEVRGMFEAGAEVAPLVPASARVGGPDGRSAGHVLCAGPVPWTDEVCGWVLNLAVAPHAQGLGLGRALLGCALRGTQAAGLPALLLSVTDGNPARRLYDAAGFTLVRRVLTVPLPARVT